MVLKISASVGAGGVNRPEDVDAVAHRLMSIGKLQGDGKSMMSRQPATGLAAYFPAFAAPQTSIAVAGVARMSSSSSGAAAARPSWLGGGAAKSSWNIDAIVVSIREFQRAFMGAPDGVMSPGGTTMRFLRDWSIKPVSTGVLLPGRLKEAWDLVNPFLPAGSYCSSGYRTKEEQRALLQGFYTGKYKRAIIEIYGKEEYDRIAKDLLGNEVKVRKMVQAAGQDIALPGTSLHETGRAIDVGGPEEIDDAQVKVIRMIARANPTVLSGKVIKERNSCVHFETR